MWVAGADGVPASGSAGLNPRLLSLRSRACMHWDRTCVHTMDITHSFFQQAFKPHHANGTCYLLAPNNSTDTFLLHPPIKTNLYLHRATDMRAEPCAFFI